VKNGNAAILEEAIRYGGKTENDINIISQNTAQFCNNSLFSGCSKFAMSIILSLGLAVDVESRRHTVKAQE
jgi:hypothetical protein